MDGTVQRFKGGSFALAVEAGLPVVPLTIAGSRQVMTKGQLTVRRGAVSLTIHEPMETADVPRDGVREMAERVRDVVVGGPRASARRSP